MLRNLRASIGQKGLFGMSRGATWGSADLTGGPIDEVFAALRRAFPDVKIERLAVTQRSDRKSVV